MPSCNFLRMIYANANESMSNLLFRSSTSFCFAQNMFQLLFQNERHVWWKRFVVGNFWQPSKSKPRDEHSSTFLRLWLKEKRREEEPVTEWTANGIRQVGSIRFANELLWKYSFLWGNEYVERQREYFKCEEEGRGEEGAGGRGGE